MTKKYIINNRVVRESKEDYITKNRSKGEKIVYAIVLGIFAIYAFTLFYPLIWGAISSLKSAADYRTNVFGLPTEYKFENYLIAFDKISNESISLVGMFWNSIWFSVGSAFITVEFTAAFAYVLNKYKFRGRNFLYGIALFMISVPIGASFISTYRLMYALHLTNSYAILFTAANVYGINLLLMHSFFSNISKTYAEAAKIDGANFYSIYFRVMRPQASPMCITVFLLLFISKWNDYMSPLLYLNQMLTLSSGLYKYRVIVERSGNYPVLFAGLIISLVPILVVFGVFSNKLMGNFSIGGIKG